MGPNVENQGVWTRKSKVNIYKQPLFSSESKSGQVFTRASHDVQYTVHTSD